MVFGVFLTVFDENVMTTIYLKKSVWERDKIWEEEGEKKYPAFSEQIRGLRQSLQMARQVETRYGSAIENGMRREFSSVSDMIAQQFLTDILFSRSRIG